LRFQVKQVIDIPVCPNCGKVTPAGKFCEHCGASLFSVQLNTPSSAYIPPVTPPLPVQVKKRNSLTRVILIVFLFFLLAFFALAILGYIIEPAPEPGPPVSKTPIPSSNPVWHTKTPDTVLIGDGGYHYFYQTLDKGDSVKIVVSTNGPPVDLLIMDEANFYKYENSFSEGEVIDAWYILNIVQDDYSFTAPVYGDYYFLIDNTPFPLSGASSGKDAKVQVTFSNYY
jgi:ribosomal protein L32